MPRYQITLQETNGITAYRLQDTERQAVAVVFPAYGNNCTEFRTTPDPDGQAEKRSSAPVDVFVPPDNLEDLVASPFHAGNPILFPFPNRVREGIYTFEGQTYSMEALLAKGWDKGAGQAIHGLVGDRVWTVEAATADENGAVLRSFFQMDAHPDIYEQYPFPCCITVIYTLSEGVLTMRTEVANIGQSNLPMGFGIHPWFPVSLQAGNPLPASLANVMPEQRQKALVHVPAEGIWELEKLMPTGHVVSVADAPEFDLRTFRALGEQFFDHVFTRVQSRADGWSEGGLRDPDTGLEMYLAADSRFREWVLYAPLSRPVIALEPYTCVTDAVNLHPQGIDAGLVTLPAGETWVGEIRFGLRHA